MATPEAPDTLPADFFDSQEAPDTLPANFFDAEEVPTTQAPLTNQSGVVPEFRNAPGVLAKAYSNATEIGMLPTLDEATTGLQVGAGIASGVAATPFVGPLGGLVVGTGVDKAIDVMAQKLGIRPEVDIDDNLADFGLDLALNMVIPGVTKLVKGTKQFAKNVGETVKTIKGKNLKTVADTKGSVVSSFGVPVTNKAEMKKFYDVIESEDFIAQSEVLSGGQTYNPYTGKFDGIVPGKKVTFEEVRQNVKNNLHGNVEKGIPSLIQNRDNLVNEIDKAFLNFNKLKKAEGRVADMLPTIDKASFDNISKEVSNQIATLKKTIQTEPAAQSMLEELELIKASLNRVPESERGPRFLADTVKNLNQYLSSLKAFDKTIAASKDINPSKGALGNMKAAISSIQQLVQGIKEEADTVIDLAVEATGLDQRVFNSNVINNYTKAWSSLNKLDWALTRKNTEILKGIDPRSNAELKIGSIVGGRTGAAINAAAGPMASAAESVGLKTPADVAAANLGNEALNRANSLISARQSLPYSPQYGSVNVPLTSGDVAKGMASGQLLGSGFGALDAEAAMLVAPEQAREANAEVERLYQLSEASNKFNMDLSSFPSVQIDNGRVFIDDPNDQQEILSIYREDPTIPMSHYYKQANKFNDKRVENELLPIPKKKNVTEPTPSIRLKKGSSNKSGNYSY
jgi:hypothetical protein